MSEALPADEIKKRIQGFGSNQDQDNSQGEKEEDAEYNDANSSLWRNAMESMTLENAKEAVKEAAESTSEAIKESTSGIVSTTQTAANSLGDAVKEGGSVLKEATGSIFQRISARFGRNSAEEEEPAPMKHEASSSSLGTLGQSSSSENGMEKVNLAELVLRELTEIRGTNIKPTESELRHFCQRAAGVTPKEQMVRKILQYLSWNSGADIGWQEKLRTLYGVKAMHEQGLGKLFKAVVVNGEGVLEALANDDKTAAVAREVLELRAERVRSRAECLQREHELRKERCELGGTSIQHDDELDCNVVYSPGCLAGTKKASGIHDPDSPHCDDVLRKDEAARIMDNSGCSGGTPADELIKSVNPDSMVDSPRDKSLHSDVGKDVGMDLLDMIDEGGINVVRTGGSTGGPGTRKPEVNKLTLKSERAADDAVDEETRKREADSAAEERDKILDLVKAGDERLALKVSYDGAPAGAPIDLAESPCVDLLECNSSNSPSEAVSPKRVLSSPNDTAVTRLERPDRAPQKAKNSEKKKIAVKLKDCNENLIVDEPAATTPALEAPPAAAAAVAKVSPTTLGDVFEQRLKEQEEERARAMVHTGDQWGAGVLPIMGVASQQQQPSDKYTALNPTYVRYKEEEEGRARDDPFSALVDEEKKKLASPTSPREEDKTGTVADISKSTASKTSEEIDVVKKVRSSNSNYGVLNLTAAGIDTVGSGSKSQCDPFGDL